MFQKRVSDMAEHPNDMTRAGEFFLTHSPDISQEILTPIVDHLGIQDLANLCSQWFKKTPRKIRTSVATADQNGKIRPVTLKPVKIISNW